MVMEKINGLGAEQKLSFFLAKGADPYALDSSGRDAFALLAKQI
jgi:hypothetical protein